MEQYQKTGNPDKIAQNPAAEAAEKNKIPYPQPGIPDHYCQDYNL